MLTSKKSGRPPLLEDVALMQRRADLLATFDFQWTDFAWKLQRADTTRAIRKAFQPIRKRSGIEPYICESPLNGTWTELRALRRKLNDHGQQLGFAQEEEGKAKNGLDQVEGALRDGGSDEALERVRDMRKAKHEVAARVLLDRQQSINRLRHELRDREASISQSELLDFIQSGRYRTTPISLANAMAGLPYIRWRQSATRCQALYPGATPGLGYQMYLEVTRFLAEPPRNKADAVEQAKRQLLAKKNPLPHSVQEFRDKWYYLRLAIETVYDLGSPKAALPYKVCTEYRKRMSSPSRSDQVLAEEERLCFFR
jgi:hypothetical protein